MKSAIAVIQVVIAVLLMLGVLLQTPKASGLGGTIGGGGDMSGGYRRRRGLEQSLLRLTAGLVAVFAIVSTISAYIGT